MCMFVLTSGYTASSLAGGTVNSLSWAVLPVGALPLDVIPLNYVLDVLLLTFIVPSAITTFAGNSPHTWRIERTFQSLANYEFIKIIRKAKNSLQ